MTDEQLEKQISEEFEKWFYKYPDKCDIRDFKSNHTYYRCKEAVDAFALPLMKKIEEVQYEANESMVSYQNSLAKTYADTITKLQKENEELRGILKFKDELLQSSVCLGKFQEIQKENEELREALDWWTTNYATAPIVAKRCISLDHIKKFNLDKEGGK